MTEERREEDFGDFPSYFYEKQYFEEIVIDVDDIPTDYDELTKFIFREYPYVPTKFFHSLLDDPTPIIISIFAGTLIFVILTRFFKLFHRNEVKSG